MADGGCSEDGCRGSWCLGIPRSRSIPVCPVTFLPFSSVAQCSAEYLVPVSPRMHSKTPAGDRNTSLHGILCMLCLGTVRDLKR